MSSERNDPFHPDAERRQSFAGDRLERRRTTGSGLLGRSIDTAEQAAPPGGHALALIGGQPGRGSGS